DQRVTQVAVVEPLLLLDFARAPQLAPSVLTVETLSRLATRRHPVAGRLEDGARALGEAGVAPGARDRLPLEWRLPGRAAPPLPLRGPRGIAAPPLQIPHVAAPDFPPGRQPQPRVPPHPRRTPRPRHPRALLLAQQHLLGAVQLVLGGAQPFVGVKTM